MELRQLEHFCALAEVRHFTRAAERVHLTQSSLSASIRALERDLGTDLFVRAPRSVQLTAAGRALLPAARRAITAAEDGRDAVAAAREVVQGELRIGALQDLGEIDLAGMLARYHRRFPDVRITVRNAGVPHLVRQVLDGVLDLAFVDRPLGPDESRLTIRTLSTDALVLAVPATSPLARHLQVSLARLGSVDFIEYRADSALRARVDSVCDEAGLRRRRCFEVDTIAAILDLVAHGAGVALLPRGSVTSAGRDRVRAVRTRPAIEREMLLVGAADRPPSPAAATLLTVVTSAGVPDDPRDGAR